MTKLRAYCGALACGAISLLLAVAAHAVVSEFTITDGSQSNVDNNCSGPVRGFTFEDCTYNYSDPDSVPGGWIGPAWAATYYRDGDSPFQKNPDAVPLPASGPGDANAASLAITGTLTLNDQDNGACNGDDTISGRFELAAGTRAFSVGPSGTGEESWGPGTVVFVLPESVPDSQQQVAGGCEYVYGDKGFPPLLKTLNLGASYPVNLVIGAAPIEAGDDDVWDTATRQDIGVGTFEGAPPEYDGNTGISVSLDEDAFMGGEYQCLDQFSDPADPPIKSPTECITSEPAAAVGTLCVVNTTTATFCANRRQLENWIMRILVGPSGDITEATAFANNESRILNAKPPTGPNSWDGSLITFTADCDNCTVAKNDVYRFVTGTTNPIALNVGANDDGENVLGDTTLTVDPTATNGTTTVTNNGGDVKLIGIDYTANNINVAFEDVFGYVLDDGVTTPDFGLEATVTLTVEEDTAPVANARTITLDSQGADPASLRVTIDAIADITGNAGGNNPTVSDDGTAQLGTVTFSGTELTYVAGAGFFQGMDTFGYTVADDNFGSPGVLEQSATAQITVNIPDLLPVVSDVEATVEAGESVNFVGSITLGNGSLDQHTADADCDNGSIELEGLSVSGEDVLASGTYTAPVDFEGADNCTYTVTDGAGDSADGAVVITVTESGVVVKLPGAGSAFDPWSLVLLLLPLLGSRRSRRGTWS